MRRVPWWLLGLAAAFGLALTALVTASFLRPVPPTYAPSPALARPVDDSLVVARTYTVDAREPERWVFFRFSQGSTVVEPGPSEWDVAFRRFHIIVNGGSGFPGRGGALALGDVPLEALPELPAEGYVGTEETRAEQPRHPVLDGWYRYNFLSHLLTPRPLTYAVRTADGRYAAFRILSYYCPGAEPACLTIRYSYRGDGDRRLVP